MENWDQRRGNGACGVEFTNQYFVIKGTFMSSGVLGVSEYISKYVLIAVID